MDNYCVICYVIYENIWGMSRGVLRKMDSRFHGNDRGGDGVRARLRSETTATASAGQARQGGGSFDNCYFFFGQTVKVIHKAVDLVFVFFDFCLKI